MLLTRVKISTLGIKFILSNSNMKLLGCATNHHFPCVHIKAFQQSEGEQYFKLQQTKQKEIMPTIQIVESNEKDENRFQSLGLNSNTKAMLSEENLCCTLKNKTNTLIWTLNCYKTLLLFSHHRKRHLGQNHLFSFQLGEMCLGGSWRGDVCVYK